MGSLHQTTIASVNILEMLSLLLVLGRVAVTNSALTTQLGAGQRELHAKVLSTSGLSMIDRWKALLAKSGLRCSEVATG